MQKSLIEKRVRVYRNLTRKTFSILDCATQKIIYYSDFVTLKNVSFKILPSGLKRAIASQQRTVHAFAEGIIVSLQKEEIPEGSKEVSYHYNKGHFFEIDSSKRIDKVSKAFLVDGTKLFI